jgi:hypothetical protein
MHIHICPVEISAALMAVEQGLPYVRASWCYHTQNIKDKINEWKGSENASTNEGQRQSIEETLEVAEPHPASESSSNI